MAPQRAPVKGRKRTSKSPALSGHNRLCGLRRPLQGRGSPLFEVGLYADAAPDLDSLPKCYSSFAPKGRPPGQFGAAAKRRYQSARLGELYQRSNVRSRLRASIAHLDQRAPREPGGGKGLQANSALNAPRHHQRSSSGCAPLDRLTEPLKATGNSSEKEPLEG